MGLYVHSLSRLPLAIEPNYYVYVLDYGWDEPLGQALHSNFRRMADLAARNKAVVVAGTDSRAFAEEVLSVHVDDPQFSWCKVNGEDGDDVLPALMISTIHPGRFREAVPAYRFAKSSMGSVDEKIILIPLRGVCKDATEVVALIEGVFRDIANQKPLANFAVAKEIRGGSGVALSDAIILKPSLWGVGVDIKELIKGWRARSASQVERPK
jgi:hypothetical protein